MAGGLIKVVNGEFVEEFCEYSKNGKCMACKTLSINCDGERFWMCEQRKKTKEKDT